MSETPELSLIVPTLMAGGIGSRLWPLSRPDHPKQFLPLLGQGRSMIETTLARLHGRGYAPPVVIGAAAQKDLLFGHCKKEDGIRILLEAEARGTAFTMAMAALNAAKLHKDAFVLALPCDHHIGDIDRFHEAVRAGLPAAQVGKIVVFGVPPTSAKTSYGYISYKESGAESEDTYPVDRFKEKPEKPIAEQYLAAGHYFWNAGIVLATAETITDHMRMMAPDILNAAEDSLQAAAQDERNMIALPQDALLTCPKLSFDHAVLEHSRDVKVVRLQSHWSDLGGWHAIWEEMDKDKDGNARQGAGGFEDCSNCLLINKTNDPVIMKGQRNMVAVYTKSDELVTALGGDEGAPARENTAQEKRPATTKRQA